MSLADYSMEDSQLDPNKRGLYGALLQQAQPEAPPQVQAPPQAAPAPMPMPMRPSPAVPPSGPVSLPRANMASVSDIDMNSLPATPRLQRQEASFDANGFRPMPSLKDAIVKAALTAGGGLLAGKVGGFPGAAGFAQGNVEGSRYREGQDVHQQELNIGQMNEQRQLQEKQLEADLREKTLGTMLNSNMAYKEGALNQRQYGTDVRAQHFQSQDRLKALGLGFDPNTDAPLPVDQLPLPQQTKMEYQQAAAAYMQARQDAIMNPDNPTFKLHADMLRLQLEHLQLAIAGLGLREQANDRDNTRLNAQMYGVGPDGNPLPGAPVTDQGNAVGSMNAANVRPNMQQKQAGSVLVAQGELINYLKQNEASLGPLRGRLNHWADLASVAPEQFARLQGMVDSWAAMQPQLHGARGIRAIEYFESKVGSPAQPLNTLVAKIEGLGLASTAVKTGSLTPTAGGRVMAGQGAPGPVSKPNLTKKGAAVADTNTLPAGKIKVKLSDGRTGTVDEVDFDPKTMKKVLRVQQ